MTTNPIEETTAMERARVARTLARQEIAELLPPEMRQSMLWNPVLLTHAQQVAKVYQNSGMLPTVKVNGQEHPMPISSILVVLDIARRTGMEPLPLLQSVYFVHGRAGWSASFLIARMQEADLTPKWTYEQGEGKRNGIERWSVTCTVPTYDDPEATITLDTDQAVEMGWTKSSKNWEHNPRLMLRYRTATEWLRSFSPNLILNLGGLRTVDELQTITIEADHVVDAPKENGAGGGLAEALGLQPADEPGVQGVADKVPDTQPVHVVDEQWKDRVRQGIVDEINALREEVGDDAYYACTQQLDERQGWPFTDTPNIDLDKLRMALRKVKETIDKATPIEDALDDHEGFVDSMRETKVETTVTSDPAPEPAPEPAEDPRKAIALRLAELKEQLSPEEWEAAKETSKVRVLKAASPLHRWQKRLEVTEAVLEGRNAQPAEYSQDIPKQPDADVDPAANVVAPDVEERGNASEGEVKALLDQLPQDDRQAACSAAMVSFNYDTQQPLWDGMSQDKLNRLRQAAEGLAS